MLFPFSFKTYLFIRCLLGGSDISVIFALVQMSVWLLLLFCLCPCADGESRFKNETTEAMMLTSRSSVWDYILISAMHVVPLHSTRAPKTYLF